MSQEHSGLISPMVCLLLLPDYLRLVTQFAHAMPQLIRFVYLVQGCALLVRACAIALVRLCVITCPVPSFQYG